jgi:hypothetical protein
VTDDEGGRLRAQPNDSRGDLLGLAILPTGSCAITLSRPSGVPPLKRSIIGVSMIPGHTALMRIFDFA